MSIRGEQWACPCGYANLFVRARCRNCGEPRRAEAPTQSVGEVIDNLLHYNTASRRRRHTRPDNIG